MARDVVLFFASLLLLCARATAQAYDASKQLSIGILILSCCNSMGFALADSHHRYYSLAFNPSM